jgi:hypothetical protein
MVIRDGRGAHRQTAGVESEARKIFNKMKLPTKENSNDTPAKLRRMSAGEQRKVEPLKERERECKSKTDRRIPYDCLTCKHQRYSLHT